VRQPGGRRGDLGQVHRLVAHALQVQVDVQQGGQQPQVGGDRGLEREEVQNPPLHIQIQPIHLVIAVDDLPAEPQVAAAKRSQRLLQQQPGLGAGLLDLALNGTQLLMKALPDLGHQPTSLPVSSLPTEMPEQAVTSAGSGEDDLAAAATLTSRCPSPPQCAVSNAHGSLSQCRHRHDLGYPQHAW
jgi:hypothetical protein